MLDICDVVPILVYMDATKNTNKGDNMDDISNDCHTSIDLEMFGDMDATTNLMDDELREDVHADMAPCVWSEFCSEYCARHLAKYGEDFEVA